ncbi:MAG: transporter [Frankiales bacterium]|nr:transporter [Frankiales bacterium]
MSTGAGALKRSDWSESARSSTRSLVSILTVIVVIDYADRNALGAVAPALKADLGISTTELGYLGAAFGIVGGLSALVAGVLVDHLPRLKLLAVTAFAWSAAMLFVGAAQGLLWLLIARSALAVVLASVGPAYPSLVGDAVEPQQRSRALGIVDSGQLIGGALGVGVGALAVGLLSWRWAFFALALPALLVSGRLWRHPEPPRRGSRDLQQLTMRQVCLQLWRTPTATRVMAAAAVGSYYLSGAAAFATVFAVAHYDVTTVVSDMALVALGLGAGIGIVAGSRDSDRLVAAGRGSYRLVRTAQLYALTVVAWIPALFVDSLLVALPFLALGSAAIAATIPILDAVRIDVLAPGIRGRSEAVRTMTRALAEGGAPFLFGLIVGWVGEDDRGLQLAFLTAMPGLLAASVLLLRARSSFDEDRARVAALDRAAGEPL